MFKHFAILFSVCLLTVGGLTGCAKPSLPEIGAITEVHGSPHIVQDNVCYYLGPWGPGAIVLKIYYEGSPEKGDSNLPRTVFGADGDPYYQSVVSIEWEYMEEDRFYFYFPLLIESLKDTTPGGKGGRALQYLYTVLSMGTPREYLINNTPIDSIDKFRKFRSRQAEVDKTTYNNWKQWWDTKGRTWYPKKG